MNLPGELDPAISSGAERVTGRTGCAGSATQRVHPGEAQSVYLHVRGGGSILAGYTTDADLALNPALLAGEPALQGLLAKAGFEMSH